MQMSRRFFLGGVLALAATPVIVRVVSPLLIAPKPIIWGDGIHDDWEGLQALLNGQEFEVKEGAFVASAGLIRNGRFRITNALDLGGDFQIEGCKFDARDAEYVTGPIIRVNQQKGAVRYSTFLRSDDYDPIVCDEWRFGSARA